MTILDSGPDGGNCASPAGCRGFSGNCADIVDQFADLPVLPDFPNGMSEYTCTAFPNDNNPVDSFIVGLRACVRCLLCFERPLIRPACAVSIAIALPASLFLASCFSIANDSEAPESWLEWYGWRKFVFGLNAHRKWHYTGPLGQPMRHVKWFIRSVGAPPPETAINLWHSLLAWATGTDPPWVEEWREAMEAETDGAEALEPASNDEPPIMLVSRERCAPVKQVCDGGPADIAYPYYGARVCSGAPSLRRSSWKRSSWTRMPSIMTTERLYYGTTTLWTGLTAQPARAHQSTVRAHWRATSASSRSQASLACT